MRTKNDRRNEWSQSTAQTSGGRQLNLQNHTQKTLSFRTVILSEKNTGVKAHLKKQVILEYSLHGLQQVRAERQRVLQRHLLSFQRTSGCRISHTAGQYIHRPKQKRNIGLLLVVRSDGITSGFRLSPFIYATVPVDTILLCRRVTG